MKGTRILLLALLLVWMLLPGAQAANVLVLSSRSAEHPWTDRVRTSLSQRLETAGVQIPITWRYLDPHELADHRTASTLADLMVQSFQNRRPEVIVALDLAVFYWLSQEGSQFRGQTPLFVGTQYPLSPMALSESEQVSGLAMEPAFYHSLETGLSLYPQTRDVYVVNDSRGPGLALSRQLEYMAFRYGRERVFTFLDGLSFSELQREFEQAPAGSLVLLAHSEALEARRQLPSSMLSLPVMPTFAYQLDWGALGGPVLSGEDLGHALAGMVVDQIERGQSPDYWTAPTTMIFNQQALDRLDLQRSRLPNGVRMVGRSEASYPGWLLSLVLVLCLFLGVATFYLTFYFWKKNRAERDLKLANQWLEDQVNRSTGELEQIYHRIHHELSERKGAEEALFASEQRFRTFVEHTPVGIVVSSPERVIEYANPAVAQYFGLESEEMTERQLSEFFPSDLVVFPASEEMPGEQAKPREWPLVSPQGEELYLLSKSAFFFETASSQKAITFVVDITELKRIETQLRQANQEARSAVRAKAEFLATMSHEIRTPLNSVLGMSHLMRETALDDDQQDYIESILKSGENLLQILNGILDYSKIEAGRMQLIEGRVDPVELAETAIEILAVQAESKGVELFAQISPELPASITADETRLNQILLNLVGNAIKFTEEGMVCLKLSPGDPGRMLISVEDTGIGISEEQQAGLFDAFSQVDSSMTRKHGGTGLGLAISSKLVHLMEGRIWLESEPNLGSTFFVDVPYKAFNRLLSDHERPDEPLFKGKRLLWIGDLQAKTQAMQERLDYWGFEVVPTESRFYSPQVLSQPLDLILLDNHLEAQEVKALLAELKQAAPCPVRYLRAGFEAKRDLLAIANPPKVKDLFSGLRVAMGGSEAKGKSRSKNQYPDLARKYPLEVLVADDNPLNLKLALKMLERMGYRAEVARNGQEAVEKVQQGGYHLVLMDIQMPVLDGLRATRRIWDLMGAKRPKIIALTANTSTEDLLRYTTQGFDGYLTKPLMPQHLAETIEVWGRLFFEEAQNGPA